MKMTGDQQAILGLIALVAVVLITAIIAHAASKTSPAPSPLCPPGHEVVQVDKTVLEEGRGFSTTKRYCDGK